LGCYPSSFHAYGELSLKMIWDSNVFMTATLIPVSRLLATDQPQFFHEPASKQAPHLMASLRCHCGDSSCSGRTVAVAMQLKCLARNTAGLPSGFSGRFFQYL
jgi:cytochrome c-type biogenesis protein CcmH/NrfF